MAFLIEFHVVKNFMTNYLRNIKERFMTKTYLTNIAKCSASIKLVFVLFSDLLLCFLSTWLGLFLRLGEIPEINLSFFSVSFLSGIIAIPVFVFFGLYQIAFRHFGFIAIWTIAKAMAWYCIFFLFIIMVSQFENVPRTIGIIQPILFFFCAVCFRVVVRHKLNRISFFDRRKKPVSKALIYGAGIQGKKIEIALRNNSEFQVIGYLDDDVSIQGKTINELPVYSFESLKNKNGFSDISLVLIALPELNSPKVKSKIDILIQKSIAVRRLPRLEEIAKGQALLSSFENVNIEELLGRSPIDPDTSLLNVSIKDHVILITGGGGSIGSELCKQIVKLKPKTIVLLEQSENALYHISEEINAECQNLKIDLVPLVGSVLDPNRLETLFSRWRPSIIFHAAAYKHVPIVEQNLLEGVKTNIFGTKLLVKKAIEHNVQKFVFISTDKAVRPTNVMGATKRIAELVLQNQSKTPKKTIFTMVRFGNVLASSGSVIPKFNRQIKQGGPVTVTHEKVTRYFMTIKEACHLVIQASTMAKGGEVFVLDMGQPVQIYDLAIKMIQLAGKKPKSIHGKDGDIDIEIVGLRPGEKLFEELFIDQEKMDTDHPRIHKSNESQSKLDGLDKELTKLHEAVLNNDVRKAKLIIKNIVPEFKTSSTDRDLTIVK